MAEAERPLAVGVDGAKGGWIAAIAHADRTEVRFVQNAQAIAALGPPVSIDIPIGLPEDVDFRACDREARVILRERRSCVFAPPARYLLGSRTFEEVQRRVAERGTKGLSRQAFGLLARIEDVDAFVRGHPDSEAWLLETHPELSFRAMNADADLPPKASTEGRRRRIELVSAAFPDFVPTASLGDVLDAYAALWTALRRRAGVARVLGGERDREGVVMRMVV